MGIRIPPKVLSYIESSTPSQIGKHWGHLTEQESTAYETLDLLLSSILVTGWHASPTEKSLELWLQYVNHQKGNNWVSMLL